MLDNSEFMMLVKDIKSKTKTLEDYASETQQHIIDSAKTSKVVNDSYGNSLLAIGTDDKIATFTNYGFSSDSLNWPLWLALYNDSWVFKRAIDKPAQDEINCGVNIEGLQIEQQDIIERQLKKYRTDLINLIQWGELFGGSIAVMMFDNMSNDDYAKPLNIVKLQQAKSMRLYVTDRWYGVAPSSSTVTNMQSLDFGKPTSYEVTFADGLTFKVHHDYILRYDNREAPRLIKSMLQGWGYAEGSHLINELARDDKLKASIQSLVDKALIEVIKMPGMRGIFQGADKKNNEQIQQRLEMVNWARNYNSLTFLDTTDEYEQNSFSGLAGLSDLLEKNMWLVSSAFEMQGVLFGDLKQGFSNDDDALERYAQTINNRCESYVRPVIEKLLHTLYLRFKIDAPVEFTFNSLLMKRQNEERMKSMNDYIDILDKLLQSGVITTEKYAKLIMQYSQKQSVNIEFTDEELAELNTNFEEENEALSSIDVNEDEKTSV